jgi:tetratricopeptide (TPR) repeat protein
MLCASLATSAVSISAETASRDTSMADPSQWQRIAVREAFASAQEIEDPYRAGEAFATIARTQIAIDDERGAEASLRIASERVPAISQPEFRGWVQHEIVVAQLALDDVIGARTTAATIMAERPQGAAYVLLARRLAHAGSPQSAQSIADAIRDPTATGEIFSELVALKASSSDIQGAWTLQRRIADRHYAATAQAYIAIAEARAGKPDRARATVMKVPRSHRSDAIGLLIGWYQEHGELSRALELAGAVEDRIYRSGLLAWLALEHKRAGDPVRCRELFAASLSLLDTVQTEPRRRLGTLIQIARLQALANMPDDARATLRRATEQVASIHTSIDVSIQGRERDTLLEGIARAHARLGDFAQAMALVDQMQDKVSRALLIRDVVAMQLAAGANSADVASGAWAIDPLASTAVQFGILASRVAERDANSAREAIVAARAQVARITDPLLPPAALATLAASSVSAGDAKLGAEIFAAALAAATSVDRADQRALAYVRMVDALSDRLLFLGRPVNGSETCGAERLDCAQR